MTTLIFIRHARSDTSVKDDLGRPLTKAGLRAAALIPDLFQSTVIDWIYSSPCKRALDTIKPLAAKRRLNVDIRSGLREREVGGWVENFFSYAETQWRDFDYKRPDGESLREVQQRYVHEIEWILTEHGGQTVVIGTHGTAMCAALNYYDSDIGYPFFYSMVDQMPFIVSMRFQDVRYLGMDVMHQT